MVRAAGFDRSAWVILLAVVALLLARPGSADTPLTAEDWLLKMGPALKMTTYRGVFVYSRGEQVSSMMIAHRYRDGMVEERLVQQDGANGEILRRGARVVCVLPDQGQIQLNRVIPSGPFAEAFSSQLTPIGRWYQPDILGNDRVAGYGAVVITLNPRDEHRYGYRLWLEAATGLLLKSQVRQGDEVLERFQFTTLEIVNELPDSEFEIQSGGRIAELSTEAGQADLFEPERMEGWTLGWRPDGFVPAASPRSGGGQAVAFSDGLATFSVFVEPVDDLGMPTGVSRIGATSVYMHRSEEKGHLITVIGEIPPTTAMRVAQSVDIDNPSALSRRD